MALASLCSSLLRSEGVARSSSPPYAFTAFVVDHKLRDGSAEEAAHVARSLRALGTSLSLNESRPILTRGEKKITSTASDAANPQIWTAAP